MKKSTLFYSIMVLSAFAQAKAIGYIDYPAKIYTGKTAPINANSHTYAKQFKTKLQQALNEKSPNFAGSYSVASWGCGSACVNYAMVDRRDGKVYPLADLAFAASETGRLSCNVHDASPVSVDELYYKSSSRLLVQHTYCSTKANGDNIYLNKYLLWHDSSKKLSLLDEKFVTSKN